MLIFKMYKLEDICVSITDGKHGDCANQDNSGFYFISAKDIVDGCIQYCDARQITEDDFQDANRRTKLEPDDIVYTNSGTIGRMALIKNTPLTNKTTFQKSVAILKPKKDIIFAEYLLYSLRFMNFYLSSLASGTAQSNLLLKDIRNFEINVCQYRPQKKIAGVLAAFDELIEVNRRKIKILEEMAQAVYNEWFVKMRFPGHEKYAPPIGNGDGTAPYRVFDSPLGPIPEGWDCMPLKEYADVQYGYPFKSNLFSNDSNGEMVIRIRNIMNDNSDTFTSEYAGNEYEVVDNDILVGMDGDFYTSIWKGGKAYLNQRVARLRSRIYDNQCYLYYSIKKPIEYFNNIIVGTTVAHLSDKEFGSIKIIKPAKEVEHHFSIILKSIVDTCINISKQNQSLSSLRDLFLPKLISGKIDVSELDIDEYALGDC